MFVAILEETPASMELTRDEKEAVRAAAPLQISPDSPIELSSSSEDEAETVGTTTTTTNTRVTVDTTTPRKSGAIHVAVSPGQRKLVQEVRPQPRMTSPARDTTIDK